MNTRERVQRAVAELEDHLKEPLDLEEAFRAAGMSKPSFYRMFFHLVGESASAYLRRRRLHEAARELRETSRRILEIALDYQYESHEAFGRAFKRQYGVTPSEARRSQARLRPYRRIDLMEAMDIERVAGPEPKRIEELPPMVVASCHIVGPKPEVRSRNTLLAWAKELGLPWHPDDCRHLGFDNPDQCNPANRGKEHGYECWMSVPEGTVGNEAVVIKRFEGGLYATVETTVAEVGGAWRRLSAWLASSRYGHGDHPYLEEVLGFEAKTEEETRLKLLIPIRKG